jgi:MFS family permease
MRSVIAPLRVPGFGSLTVAYAVNQLGNWLGEVALAVLVYEETGSPLATAALFIAMQFLPAVASQPLIAGAEARGTRRALSGIYAAEAAAFALIALLAEHFLLPVIVMLAALDGMLAIAGRAFTRSAGAAVLLPAGLLREGNAVLNICFTGAGAVGPVLAGLAVAGLGVRPALMLNAVSFLLAAMLISITRSLPDAVPERFRWRERLKDGTRYVAGHPLLRDLLAAQGLVLVFFAAVVPIEIVYAKESLDAGTSGYGALLASWGVGMVVGSLVFASRRRARLDLLLLFSSLVVGVAYLGMGAAATIYVACAFSAAGGAGNGIQWISMVTSIQGLTPARYQARVVGLLEAIGAAMPGLGFIVGGVVTELLSPRAAFTVAGAGVVLIALGSAARIGPRSKLLRAGDAAAQADEVEPLNPAMPS